MDSAFSSCNNSPVSPTPESDYDIRPKTASEGFTAVFIDFDDTLIPTSLRQLFKKCFRIDLFTLLHQTELKQLQYSIIKTLNKIRRHLSTNKDLCDDVKICVVSNASTKWLTHMLYGNAKRKIIAPFRILCEYFDKNGIEILSAYDQTWDFLKKRFDNKIARNMMDLTVNENKQFKWMWKYTAFSSLVAKFKIESGMECKRVISFGDGMSEYQALNEYAASFHTESLNFKFIKAPTIFQLESQWIYIEQNIDRIIEIDGDRINKPVCMEQIKGECELFYVYNLMKVYRCKNNKFFTDKLHQLPAVADYFEQWINFVKTFDREGRKLAMNIVCGSIYGKIYAAKPIPAVKTMMANSIFTNENFSNYFNKFLIDQHSLSQL